MLLHKKAAFQIGIESACSKIFLPGEAPRKGKLGCKQKPHFLTNFPVFAQNFSIASFS